MNLAHPERALREFELRNLVLGLYEVQKARGQTRARSFPSWRRQLTVRQMIGLITRPL
jgi:hypothetical protein